MKYISVYDRIITVILIKVNNFVIFMLEANLVQTLFSLIVLIMSVIIHEVSHGFAAYSLGDPTAKVQGRLTMNPIPHIDIMWSIVIPFIMLLSGGLVFGGAKPVPFNPNNLNNKKWGSSLVALAGPSSNLLLAVLIGIIFRIYSFYGDVSSVTQDLFVTVVGINLILAIFNSIPIPPLDGSKIIEPLLPYSFTRSDFYRSLEMNGTWILLVIVLFGGTSFIYPIFLLLINLILG